MKGKSIHHHMLFECFTIVNKQATRGFFLFIKKRMVMLNEKMETDMRTAVK